MIKIPSYNNKVLSAQEREDFRVMANVTIQDFNESIEGLHELSREFTPSQNEEHNKIMNILLEIGMFTGYTYCDCVILLKHFILSANSYEKSFFRGKLKVLLNEGFKRLYGCTAANRKESYYAKVGEIIHIFPGMQSDYESILSDLEQTAQPSHGSWWKDVRDSEVHFDIAQLDRIRHEEINESKEAIESLQLTTLLNRVNRLMRDLSKVYINHMINLMKTQK